MYILSAVSTMTGAVFQINVPLKKTKPVLSLQTVWAVMQQHSRQSQDMIVNVNTILHLDDSN